MLKIAKTLNISPNLLTGIASNGKFMALVTRKQGATGEELRQALGWVNPPTFWHLTRLADRLGAEYVWNFEQGDSGTVRYWIVRKPANSNGRKAA